MPSQEGLRHHLKSRSFPKIKYINEYAINSKEKKCNSTNLANDKNQNPSEILTVHQVLLPLPLSSCLQVIIP